MNETFATSSFAPIFCAIIDQLVDVTGLGESQVIPDARDDDDMKLQADQYIVVRVGAARLGDEWAGAGRNALVLRREVLCVVWTRMATDRGTSDRQWLVDQTRGHIVAEEAVYDALSGFQPKDDDGNWIVKEPLEPQPARAPKRNKNQDRKLAGWGQSAVSVTVLYALPLPTPDDDS